MDNGQPAEKKGGPRGTNSKVRVAVQAYIHPADGAAEPEAYSAYVPMSQIGYCTKPLPRYPLFGSGAIHIRGVGVSLSALHGEELAHLLSASQSVFRTGEVLEDR